MTDTLHIDGRFCGPPGCANGGYVGGLLTRLLGDPLTLTLRKPVRLDAPVTVEREGDRVRIVDGGEVVAQASVAKLDIEPVHRPTFAQAEAASRNYAGFVHHPFPRCFVCGTERAQGDGLRVFAGPVEGMSCVASPWVPHASVAERDGRMGPEIVWAALDCPGCFGAFLARSPQPAVLGRLTARVMEPVHVGEPCVVIGWPIAHEGRKHEVGTALIGEQGNICGVARATWIEVPAWFSGP